MICLRVFAPEDAGRDAPSLEHVIPEALCKSGEMVISEGTCVGCNNDANARYEQAAMHADFNSPRILLELRRKRRTRAKRKDLKLPNVALNTDPIQDAKFDIELSAEEYPNNVSLLMFEPAGKLLGIEKSGDVTSLSFQWFHIGRKPNEATNVTTREERDWTAFALTIAKIAYCFAAAELGLDAFDGSEIRALLRGERDDTFNFVGGLSVPQHLTDRHLHKLYLRKRGDLLTVIVHLFASCKAGAYEVVVGKRITVPAL